MNMANCQRWIVTNLRKVWIILQVCFKTDHLHSGSYAFLLNPLRGEDNILFEVCQRCEETRARSQQHNGAAVRVAWSGGCVTEMLPWERLQALDMKRCDARARTCSLALLTPADQPRRIGQSGCHECLLAACLCMATFLDSQLQAESTLVKHHLTCLSLLRHAEDLQYSAS